MKMMTPMTPTTHERMTMSARLNVNELCGDGGMPGVSSGVKLEGV
jgi:hypothetical protein